MNSSLLNDMKRIVLRYVLPGSFLIFILWFLFNISLYSFNITYNNTKNETTLAFISGDSKREGFSLFGVYFVPRNTDYIEVTSGEKKTRLTLQDKPLLGIKSENLELKYQNTVTKIGKSGLGCNNITDKIAFSYRCFSDTSNILLYADRTKNEIDNKLSGYTIEPANSTPYLDGILSLYTSEGDESDGVYGAAYTNIVTGVVVDKTLPIPASNQVRFTPDMSGEPGFSIIDSTAGRVYYFESLESKPIEIKKIVRYKSSKDGVDCTLKNKRLACYYGVTTESDIGSETAEEQNTLRGERSGNLGEINIYDFSKNTVTTLESGARPIQKICLAADGRIYALSDTSILISPSTLINSKGVNFSVIANDADQFACGNEVTYSANRSLYRLSGVSSSLVFNESRMRLSTLQGYGNKVMFNTFLDTDNEDDIPHTYTLDSKTKATSARPEKVLPYSINSSDLFLEVDYNNDTIFIKPVISVISDRENNQTVIDQVLLSETKKQIEQQLKDDGLFDKYKIFYSF